MSNDRSDRFDAVFKALANSTRRSILDTLRDQPLTTGVLAAQFGELDRCTVMQHLKVLEDADLIIAERRGRERWNHLNPLPIHDIHERWIGPHAKAAVSRLAQLKRELEAPISGKAG
ncbi:MAG TPA: metalloregulator ArsR/SmtB family transcription factor [Sphingomicrobium sp.]|nr:metalloregulator ArsR/SmtB family transcription factor [Sphingomicrobium sp.]